MKPLAYVLCAVLLAAGATGCTSNDQAGSGSAAEPGDAATTAAAAPEPNSKEALEARAQELDQLASEGKATEAYAFYSQRCKNIIGDLESYTMLLDEWRKGRNFQFGGVTVKVNGSSAQVVTVDNDPNAPASSMDPRTWTFIDGKWQFDNC